MIKKILNKTFLCLIVAMSLTSLGCLGYRLGSSLPPGVTSIYIPTFLNSTGEPQLEAEATVAAMQEFQKDGSLYLETSALADATLSVTLTDLTLEPVLYDKQNLKFAKEYRLKIKADFALVRKNGELIQNGTVSGETVFDAGSDLPSARRAALPLASADLAHQIVKTVVEYW